MSLVTQTIAQLGCQKTPGQAVVAIPSLAQQLQAAAEAARRLAAEALRPAKNSIRPAMRLGKYGGKGLRAALLARLPVGRERAIGQTAIRKLLPDIDYAPTGLSAALSVLARDGLICRANHRPPYLYYRNR